ncbi:MAG: aldo/keto reductase [Rhodospirillales bacterium]|nr:aldo/keto reductase [Acetobacter sp.]
MRLGLGCWAIGGPFWAGEQPLGWGEMDDAESRHALRVGFDAGARFFDTADVYGCGRSERVLGEALADVREQIVIATKFGNTFDADTLQLTGQDTSPEYIRQACEASLRRLRTDRIDLYQLHLSGLDLGQAAGEVRDTLEGLVAAGKVRAYGWSTDDPERAAVFADGAKHNAAVQHELSLFADAPEMLTHCTQRRLASINRSPLAMGLLTGKFHAGSRLGNDDVRGKQPEWLRFFDAGQPKAEWLRRLEAVREVLQSGGRTLAQGALAWIWGRSGVTVPIPGFRTVAQASENAEALTFGPLTEAQVNEVRALLSLDGEA